jgi:hypothetical protein
MARDLTGYQERMRRTIVSKLLEKGLLHSEGAKMPLRLAFPQRCGRTLVPKALSSGMSEEGLVVG